MSSGEPKAPSPVKAVYKGASVFITGATGFVGVALIEKLLRATEVDTLYLLIRPKRGKDVQERLHTLTQNSVFERLTESRGPDVFSKLKAVAGDVNDEGLGLSPADRQLITSRVNFVFHSAATLDFDAPFKDNITTNLLGTRRVVQLAKECTQLKAMVHVSSAFVNADKHRVEEIIYPAPDDADKIIAMATTLTDTELNEGTAKILKGHPNSYTFTKALAEHEVANAITSFPSAIVRPSMITSSWKEPVAGWTVSKNGPTGFMMGASKGVVRRIPLNADLVADYIPVDVVVNEIILAGWQAATTSPANTLVFHATSSVINPFRWNLIEAKLDKYLHKFPLNSAVWYPSLKLLPSLALFRVSAVLFHFLPAYVLDAVFRLMGQRPVLVRLHTNIGRSVGLLETFIFSEWFFDNFRTQTLSKSLSPIDKETFFIDVQTLNWENYVVDLLKGVRQYLSKESPKSLPAARRKDKILLVAHLLLQAGVFGLIWFLFALATGLTYTKSGWIVPLTYMLLTFL